MEEWIIRTCGLTKRYGEQVGLSNLELHVRQGRIYGLLGRNGAGKTTAMKLLLGLTQPTQGEVFLFGKPLHGHEREALSRIGSLIESPGFYPNLTGTENLRIFARLRGVAENAVERALNVVGLPYRDKKRFSQYSLGMKQRLAIALAILHDPELLILDEPVNGLDPIGIAEMRAFIRRLCDEQGKTVLISSHLLPEIALLADDVGILDRGVLLEEGTLTELEARERRWARFDVSDARRAARLFETVYHVKDVSVEDGHTLCLPGKPDMEPLIALLVENGIGVREARLCEETLEDYFRRVTGGEGIA